MSTFNSELSFCLHEYLSFKVDFPELLVVCPEAANFVRDDEIDEDYIEDYLNDPRTSPETLNRIYEVVKVYGEVSNLPKHHIAY
jgi:hypothetical protein